MGLSPLLGRSLGKEVQAKTDMQESAAFDMEWDSRDNSNLSVYSSIKEELTCALG